MVEEQKVGAEAGAVVEEAAERSPEERLEAIEGVVFELIDRVEKLANGFEGFKKQAVTKPKGLFGGKRTPTPMKDLKTGIVYPSKAAVGKNLGAEAGADPLDTMAYYTVIKVLKMPDGADRFVEASAEESAKSRAEFQAKIEADVAESNARLQAETEAEAKAAEGAPAPAAKQAPKAQQKKK